MSDKLIITCAITGAETTKEQNPNLPITAEEQAEAAHDCFRAGASIIHLHVRDDNGKPSQELERFQRVRRMIGDRCDVIVQFSTGGAVGEAIERRLAPLALKPESASLNIGSMNLGDEVFVNLPQDIERLAAEMRRLKIKPEIEVYDVGMLEYGVSLVKKGVIDAPAHFQFVMGTKYGISGSVENLAFMKSKLPEDATFAVAGIGRFQYELARPAIEMGGHVRCGFEDNVYFTKGVLAESNCQLVTRIADLARSLGRKIATPDDARQRLGIHSALNL